MTARSDIFCWKCYNNQSHIKGSYCKDVVEIVDDNFGTNSLVCSRCLRQKEHIYNSYCNRTQALMNKVKCSCECRNEHDSTLCGCDCYEHALVDNDVIDISSYRLTPGKDKQFDPYIYIYDIIGGEKIVCLKCVRKEDHTDHDLTCRLCINNKTHLPNNYCKKYTATYNPDRCTCECENRYHNSSKCGCKCKDHFAAVPTTNYIPNRYLMWYYEYLMTKIYQIINCVSGFGGKVYGKCVRDIVVGHKIKVYSQIKMVQIDVCFYSQEMKDKYLSVNNIDEDQKLYDSHGNIIGYVNMIVNAVIPYDGINVNGLALDSNYSLYSYSKDSVSDIIECIKEKRFISDDSDTNACKEMLKLGWIRVPTAP